MNSLQVSDQLVEEIQALFTEGEFNSRWTLIETYHQVGKVIAGVNVNRTELLQALAPKVGRSVRTLWYAVKFYDTFPDLNILPEGKNITMNKVITKYLTASKSDHCEHNHKKRITFEQCEDCGQSLGRVKNE